MAKASYSKAMPVSGKNWIKSNASVSPDAYINPYSLIEAKEKTKNFQR